MVQDFKSISNSYLCYLFCLPSLSPSSIPRNAYIFNNSVILLFIILMIFSVAQMSHI